MGNLGITLLICIVIIAFTLIALGILNSEAALISLRGNQTAIDNYANAQIEGTINAADSKCRNLSVCTVNVGLGAYRDKIISGMENRSWEFVGLSGKYSEVASFRRKHE